MNRMAAVVILLLLTGVLSVLAQENKGAEQIILDGGDRGVVQFPHHRHQNKLGDCKICHDLFPREQGGISRLKKEGQLISKQVMNKHCIKCHKAEQQAGHPAGPVTCSKCHEKG
jgi:hypothetical protein